jgi:predicted glycosyltransferase
VRVWVDLTNSAHVVVLRPLVQLLERGGHDVTLTARPLSHTTELLDHWGHHYTVIGHHGGARRLGKALAGSARAAEVFTFARGKGFDYGLGHGSTDLPAVGRVLRIPNTTMFDYEWARLQHSLNCRLATRVLVPDAIPADRLARYGARPPKLVRYPGLKEEYYLGDFEPDDSVLGRLGLDPERVIGVVRTAPSYALYLGGSENELVPRVLRRLLDASAQVVVLARTEGQRTALRAVDERLIVPDRVVDGSSLVALADLVVSAGGTMIREAAVLGTPVWSIFEGRRGAVDEQLERDGRVRFLHDPDELVVEKAPAKERRASRDPAELLRLAVPGASAARRR